MIKDFLKQCKDAYYAGNPIIEDDQYDALVDKYGEDSVGSQVGTEVPHYRRMYSLQKFYDDEKNPALNNRKAWIYTHKYDGAAVSALYLSGILVQVLTRGDGIKGRDITYLFTSKYYTSIINSILPLTFSDVVQINGEIVAPKTIKNARNYAAGALGLRTTDEFYSRDLHFIAYNIFPHRKTYTKDLNLLKYAKFLTPQYENEEEDFFPTDGIVARLNNNEAYEKLGYTAHHPRGAFALKERNEGVKTTILDVEWQTGKSGKVTPVAILEPIEIDGATVSRATLNNVGFIEALGVEIGDSVMVERAGGIIPRIIKKAV